MADLKYSFELSANAEKSLREFAKLRSQIQDVNSDLKSFKINNLFQGLSDSGKKETDKLKIYFADLEATAKKK